MKQKVYRCGVCGDPGHNRQTCGKMLTAPLVGKKSVIHNSPHKADMEMGGGVKTWDDHLNHITTLTDTSTGEGVEMYTVDNMLTLWTLMNGATGHPEGRWSPADSGELQEFINNTHEQFPNLPLETWEKFLSQFSGEAKMYTLGQYSEVWEKKFKGLEPVILPEKLYPVFMADKSEDVRGSLVGKMNTPPEVTHALIDDGNMRAIVNIVNQDEVDKGTLERIVEAMPKVEQKMAKSGKKGEENAKMVGTFLRIKNQLAEHPHTPPHYLIELLRNPVTAYPAAANPSTPIREVEKVATELYNFTKDAPKLIAQANDMITSLEHAQRTHGTSGGVIQREIESLKEKKAQAEEELHFAEGVGSTIVATGRCGRKINKKYITAGLKKAVAAVKNGESEGGRPVFVYKTIQDTPLTSQEIHTYYTMIGGANTPLKDALTTLFKKENLPLQIVEECEAHANRNPKELKWLKGLVEQVKRDTHTAT